MTSTTESNLILSVELVDYTKAYHSLYIDDIYHVIEDVLKLNPSEDVVVIQKGFGHAPKTYKVGLKDEAVWFGYNIPQFIEKKFEIETGKRIMIQRAYETYKDVTVKNVPPHWNKDYVERVLSYYGLIISMTQERLKFSTRKEALRYGYGDIWNGNWRVRMKVKKAIPSTLIISDAKIEFHYRDQDKTCWRCGMDHPKRNCQTKPDDFINKFSIDEFPELSRPHHQQETDDTPENHTEEENGDQNTGENQAENHTGEGQQTQQNENHTGENSDSDMDAIRPATQVERDQIVSGNTNTVEDLEDNIEWSNVISNDDILKQDKVPDLSKMEVPVEVEHSYASQNVRGALLSPDRSEVLDADNTATASEGEAVEKLKEPEEMVQTTPESVNGTQGITPGQKGQGELVASSIESQASIASEDMDGINEDTVTPGQQGPVELVPVDSSIESQATAVNEVMDGVTEIEVTQVDLNENGFWTVYGNKRKGRGNSTDEDSDTTVKASFGNLVNSIISTGNSFRKKMKENQGEDKDKM